MYAQQSNHNGGNSNGGGGGGSSSRVGRRVMSKHAETVYSFEGASNSHSDALSDKGLYKHEHSGEHSHVEKQMADRLDDLEMVEAAKKRARNGRDGGGERDTSERVRGAVHRVATFPVRTVANVCIGLGFEPPAFLREVMAQSGEEKRLYNAGSHVV